MKNLFYISFFLLILFSCSKERTINLIAKNAVTGVPYPGLTYYIVEEKTGYDGEEFKTVATGQLDSNGEKIVSIKRKKNRSYVVRIAEPLNTCYNKQISQSFDSPFDVNGTFTFEFAECAYLKQNINNINCQGASDYMILYTSNKVNSLGLTGWEFNGCSGYTGTNFSKVPMGEYFFEWHVTRLGITNVFYDTISLSENEYRTYTIDY